MTGVATSTLSKIENNKMSPTFDVITRIMSGLKIPPAYLFNDGRTGTGNQTPTVDRRDNPVSLSIPGADYEILCADNSAKEMFTTIITLHTTKHNDLIGHAGEEFLFVLDGTLEVSFRDQDPIRLDQDECLYLNSRNPHSFCAVGPTPVRFLAVSNKSAFDDVRDSDNNPISAMYKLRNLILK